MKNNISINNLSNVMIFNDYKELLTLKDRLDSLKSDKNFKKRLSEKDLNSIIISSLDKLKNNSRFPEYITLEIINVIGDLIDDSDLNRSILPTVQRNYLELVTSLNQLNKNLINYYDSKDYIDITLHLNDVEIIIDNLIDEVFSVITNRENYILVWHLTAQYNMLKMCSI